MDSITTRMVACFSSRIARIRMARYLQSKIDECRRKLNMYYEVFPYGLSVKWTSADEIETDLKENRVVVMMRPYQSLAKNLAHVVSVYVTRGLLPQARRYVEPNLMSRIEHTISKSIIKENPHALAYLSEIIERDNDKVKSWIIKIDKLNEQGTLTRILFPEIKRLSILYPKEPDQKTFKESEKVASLLYRLATNEAGVDIFPSYKGSYIKMVVVSVSKREKGFYEEITPQLKFIKHALSKGIDHFYIISTGPFIKYAKNLIQVVEKTLGLKKVYEEEYEGIYREKSTKLFSAMLIMKE